VRPWAPREDALLLFATGRAQNVRVPDRSRAEVAMRLSFLQPWFDAPPAFIDRICDEAV
jgi:hypothetical protein